jgi:hypothetical protein
MLVSYNSSGLQMAGTAAIREDPVCRAHVDPALAFRDFVRITGIGEQPLDYRKGYQTCRKNFRSAITEVV